MRLVLSSVVLVGAIVAASVWTSADAAEPSGCRTVMVTYPDGSQKPMLAPPTPSGGTLTRLRDGRFRFTWRFASLPTKCRPSHIRLSLKFKPPLTVITFKAPVTATSGARTTFRLPKSLTTKVNYGLLRAEMPNGMMSELRRVPLRQA
jgi:hypothetical protein